MPLCVLYVHNAIWFPSLKCWLPGCWLALLAEAHEDQATDAERRDDTEQAMGCFADSMGVRDVIGVVSSIEIPLPGTLDEDESGPECPEGPLAASLSGMMNH